MFTWTFTVTVVNLSMPLPVYIKAALFFYLLTLTLARDIAGLFLFHIIIMPTHHSFSGFCPKGGAITITIYNSGTITVFYALNFPPFFVFSSFVEIRA